MEELKHAIFGILVVAVLAVVIDAYRGWPWLSAIRELLKQGKTEKHIPTIPSSSVPAAGGPVGKAFDHAKAL